jgi:hypothetical protein
MAGMKIDAAAVNAARAEGYSDAEIVSHLAQKNPGQFKEAQDAGYTPAEILDHVAPRPQGALDGLGTAFKQGVAGAVGGVGETLKQTGIAPGAGETLTQTAAGIAPQKPVDTTIVDQDGVNAGNVPRMLAEQSPQLAAVIAAAKLGSKVPGGVLAKTLGGLGAAGLTGAGMIFGPKVKENAAIRTGSADAEPNADDRTRAALTTIPEAAIGALGISRFLPGAGKVTTTGLKGTGDALKQLSTRVLDNTAAEGAANITAQVGRTAGTEGGLKVDPVEAANAAASGGLTAGAIATPRAAVDVRGAVRDRKFGGDNQAATTAVANRFAQQTTNQGRTDLKNVKAAGEALDAVKGEVSAEVKAAADALRQSTPLSPEATNALTRAAEGTATKGDYKTIADAAPGSEGVINLARQANVVKLLERQGSRSNGKFKGGLSTKMENQLRIIMNPLGTATTLGGAALASAHLPSVGMYSAPAIGTAVGAYGAARAMDHLSGARSPANRFMQKFADGETQVRPDPVAAPEPERGSPTGPKIAGTAPRPWGYPENTPDPKQLLARMRALENSMKARAKQKAQAEKAMIAEATPELEKLAAFHRPNAGETGPAPMLPLGPKPEAQPDPRQLIQQMNALVNSRKAASTRAAATPQSARSQAPVAEPAPGPVASADTAPGVIPAATLQAARVLVRGLNTVAKIKKVNGKVTEQVKPTPKAPPQPKAASEAKGTPEADNAYVPVEPKYRGKTDDEVAGIELTAKMATDDVRSPGKYRERITEARKKRRNAMAEIAAEHDADAELMADLLEQLHVVRRRADASKAVNHYAKQMTPEGAAAVRKRLDAKFIESTWPK